MNTYTLFPSCCSFPLIKFHLFLCHVVTCKQGTTGHGTCLGRCLCFPITLVMGWSQKYLLFWRGMPCIWTRCALLLQENYNNGSSTHLSLCFSCAVCACHWSLLLIPTIPSVSHSCNSLPGSLSRVHQVIRSTSNETSQLHVPRHSLTPPSYPCSVICCALRGDQPCPWPTP